MALSYYKSAEWLNKNIIGSSTQTTPLTTNTMGDVGGFDKRNGPIQGDKTYQAYINNSKLISEMLTNKPGCRSPYYRIGEAEGMVGRTLSRYMQNALGNTIRAITDITDWALGVGQTGVIIDGFGTVSGKIDVELTKNPVVFVSSSVSDSRIRTPNTVTMTVYVSNLYSDTGLDSVIERTLVGWGVGVNTVNVLMHDGNTRAQQALYSLRGLQEKGRPFSVYTPHGVYENMVIKSLAPKTTAENVDTLECDITFQEMIMYEPYYDSNNTKFPTRSNVLGPEEGTLLGKAKSIINGDWKIGRFYANIARESVVNANEAEGLWSRIVKAFDSTPEPGSPS